MFKFQEFLLLEEFSETRDVKSRTIGNGKNLDSKHGGLEGNVIDGISARNVAAKWNSVDDSDAVNNITFEIKKGKCYGICGSVGDGKVKYDVFATQNCLNKKNLKKAVSALHKEFKLNN